MPKNEKVKIKVDADLSPAKRSIKAFSTEAKSQLNGITGKVGGSISKIASAAGPYGMAIGAAVGAVTAGVGIMISQLNLAEQNMQRMTTTFGNVSQKMTIQSNVITKAFKVDQAELERTVKSTAVTFGISYEEAFAVVAKGFKKGADAQGQFLSTTKEFGVQYKKAGATVEETTALITAFQQKGFLDNKASDSIKEGTLKINDMNKATKEALSSLGIDSAQLEKDLASGSVRGIDALKDISGRIVGLGENSNVAAKAVTDIFGGPGEDVGFGFVETLSSANMELDEMDNRMTGIAESQLAMNGQWELLKTNIFGTGGAFERILMNVMNFATKIIRRINIFFEVGLVDKFKMIWNSLIDFGLAGIGNLVKGALGMWNSVAEALGLDDLIVDAEKSWAKATSFLKFDEGADSAIGKAAAKVDLLADITAAGNTRTYDDDNRRKPILPVKPTPLVTPGDKTKKDGAGGRGSVVVNFNNEFKIYKSDDPVVIQNQLLKMLASVGAQTDLINR